MYFLNLLKPFPKDALTLCKARASLLLYILIIAFPYKFYKKRNILK